VKVLRRKLLRDMRARRAQFLAVVVTIGLGLTLFAVSYDAYRNLLASYHRMFELTSFADYTIVGGDVPAALVQGGALPGVAQADERRVADVPLRIGGDRLLGRVVGVSTGRRPPVNGMLVLKGHSLPSDSSTAVLVEQHAADHFGLAPGDTLDVLARGGWQPLGVVGVAASSEYLWPSRSRQDLLPGPDDFAVVFASEPVLDLLDPSLVRREVLFAYEEGVDRAALDARLAQIATRWGTLDGFSRAEQPSNAALSEDIQGFGVMAVMFPALFLGAAGVAAYVLLTRIVLAQRSQIGLLLANGYRRRTVFGHYLGFGLAAGLLGAVPGLVVGALLARVVTRFYTDAISVPVRVVELHSETVVIGLAFGLVTGALATLAPALWAARLAPATAMRGATVGGHGGRSLLERLAPALGRLPARGKMVVRGVGRSRRRSLSTALGVVLAATLVMTSLGLIDTTRELLGRQFEEVLLQDAQLYLAPDAAPAIATQIVRVGGVAAVEPAADQVVSVRSAAGTYQTSLVALDPDTTMHGFSPVVGGPDGLPARGVLLGRALQDRLDLSVGDTVALELPVLDARIEQPVAGFVEEPLGTYAYVALPVLAAALERPREALVNTLLVRFDPAADRAAVQDSLTATPGVAAAVDARSLERMVEQYMSLFYAFVGLMMVLGAVMAFALVFTTISANVSERITELASLRAAGMGRRTLARLITGENLLLTALGIVPGLLMGFLSARLFMASFSSDLFTFDLAMNWTTPLLVAVVLLGATLISQWPVLRAVDRIDIARVVRERSQ
jgi:putative ABC transport system permease protein